MSKYKLYLITENYTEINSIDESEIDDLCMNFRKFRKALCEQNSDIFNPKANILKHFDNIIMDGYDMFLFDRLTVNHVDNKIEINCA